MTDIDPRIIVGAIGAVSVLLTSFVTQLLVFYIQNKEDRLLASYQYVVRLLPFLLQKSSQLYQSGV